MMVSNSIKLSLYIKQWKQTHNNRRHRIDNLIESS